MVGRPINKLKTQLSLLKHNELSITNNHCHLQVHERLNFRGQY